MLTFIGLGLYDKQDVSERGLALIRNADHVFLEGYTSRLMELQQKNLRRSTRSLSACSGGLTWSSTPARYWTAP